jgi:hypothetical protein
MTGILRGGLGEKVSKNVREVTMRGRSGTIQRL